MVGHGLNKSSMTTTVNSKKSRGFIFAKLRDAKFRENNTSVKCEITLSFTDEGKSCPSREFYRHKYAL